MSCLDLRWMRLHDRLRRNMGDQSFTKQLALRVTARDQDRIERLAQRIQIATTAAVMRAALRVGLDALERDPALIFETQPVGSPERCMAELPDGDRCGKPADSFDGARMVAVCAEHLRRRPPVGQRLRRQRKSGP